MPWQDTDPTTTESCENWAFPTVPSPTADPTNPGCSCQINLFKHTSDFWPSISWQMGSKWKASKSKDAMEETFLRCRGNALWSSFSVSLRPQITVLRLTAPEILSPPRRWQTPRRGQVLNPSTTLFRDVLTSRAAPRSGSLAAALRGDLVHSLALQNVGDTHVILQRHLMFYWRPLTIAGLNPTLSFPVHPIWKSLLMAHLGFP